MKAPISIAAVVVLLVTTFLVMGAADPDRDRDDSIAQLKARISFLERRVDSLEKKLQTNIVRRSPTTIRPSVPPRDQSPPGDWRRKVFDATPYFIVRSAQVQSRSSRRISPKSCR